MEDFAPVALAMATSDRQVPDLGAHNRPNQSLQFDFPKRAFWKDKGDEKSVSVSVVWEVVMAAFMTAPSVILVSLLSRHGG